jgi:hypothetical protein
MLKYARKVLDTADIVRDAMFLHGWKTSSIARWKKTAICGFRAQKKCVRSCSG